MKWLSRDSRMSEWDMITNLQQLSSLSKEKSMILKNSCSSPTMLTMQKKWQRLNWESLKSKSRLDKNFETQKSRNILKSCSRESISSLSFKTKKRRRLTRNLLISKKNKIIFKWNLWMSKWKAKQNNKDKSWNSKTTTMRCEELKTPLEFQTWMRSFKSFKHRETPSATLKSFRLKMNESKKSWLLKSMISNPNFKKLSMNL